MQARISEPSVFPTDATAWPSCSMSACRRASASAAVVILCGGSARRARSGRGFGRRRLDAADSCGTPLLHAPPRARCPTALGARRGLAGVSVPICSVDSPAAAREMRSVMLIWDAELGWPACTPLQWLGANAGGARDGR